MAWLTSECTAHARHKHLSKHSGWSVWAIPLEWGDFRAVGLSGFLFENLLSHMKMPIRNFPAGRKEVPRHALPFTHASLTSSVQSSHTKSACSANAFNGPSLPPQHEETCCCCTMFGKKCRKYFCPKVSMRGRSTVMAPGFCSVSNGCNGFRAMCSVSKGQKATVQTYSHKQNPLLQVLHNFQTIWP